MKIGFNVQKPRKPKKYASPAKNFTKNCEKIV